MAKHRNILPLHHASQVRSGAVVKVAFETPNLFYFHFMLENEEIEWKQSSLQITLIFSYSLVWQNLKYFERRLSGCTKAMFSFANWYVLKASALLLKYGFHKKYFQKSETLTSWTLFSPVFFQVSADWLKLQHLQIL